MEPLISRISADRKFRISANQRDQRLKLFFLCFIDISSAVTPLTQCFWLEVTS
jgi:hypothetical protein